jgi:hypothetical protein
MLSDEEINQIEAQMVMWAKKHTEFLTKEVI